MGVPGFPTSADEQWRQAITSLGQLSGMQENWPLPIERINAKDASVTVGSDGTKLVAEKERISEQLVRQLMRRTYSGDGLAGPADEDLQSAVEMLVINCGHRAPLSWSAMVVALSRIAHRLKLI